MNYEKAQNTTHSSFICERMKRLADFPKYWPDSASTIGIAMSEIIP